MHPYTTKHEPLIQFIATFRGGSRSQVINFWKNFCNAKGGDYCVILAKTDTSDRPACAGMTLACAGMTLACAGMTLACAGMN